MARSIGDLLLAIVLVAAASAGCAGGGGGGGTGGAGGMDPADCVEPTSQGLSQPCCLAHGVDACGANLFCAAFDGRTQPTCYPERSRQDRQSCFEDRHCTSHSCNAEAGACRSMPSTQCDPAIGCAADPAGGRHACVVESGTCRRIGDGSFGAVCEEAADCNDRLVCADGLCTVEGEVCGELTGDGPCLADPGGDGCIHCRAESLHCSFACPDATGALRDCGLAAGCIDTGKGEVDPRCLVEACDREFCALEACVRDTDECFSPPCY